ncbi:MAG: serine/threonine-protein kinase [Byssovorax sp.]
MVIADEKTAGAASGGGGGEVMPKQFGKYTLLRRLAAGGMAELFLALHRSVAGFEKLIVIKRILPSMNQDQGFIEMLLHEARVAATLSHPNVVQIFDVGQVDGTYYIAMEHIHGEDIQAIVRGMKKMNVAEFPLEHTISILLGTCAGLAYAHDKRDLDGAALGIVHRDISPRNIVVSFTGDVKIVDFGIAKSGTEPGEGDTPSGQLKGKAPYMSPEQASGQPIDWRSDIFAAGVMLFELTTGRRLFKGASEFETLKMICDKEYPLPSQVKDNYPPELERIVMRALAKRREDRYQSAREMQADLEFFAREERIAVSQVSLTKWMESLFADKLAQQKEALQDVKQLADVIAAQQQSTMLYEGGTTTGTGTLNASGASSVRAPLPRKSSPIGIIAAVLGLVVLGGGFVYMRHQAEMQREEMTVAHDKEMHDRAPNADSAAEAKGALDITTTPPGCAIWINGDLRVETTPAKIDKLPFGRALSIKITKEGLEPYHETVTLSDALATKTIVTELKTGSVTVLLKVDPPATVWIDGKPWKGDRAKIDGISAGEEHKIVLSASGYVPKTLSFTAQPGETKTFTEALLKADPNAPVPAGKPDETKTAAPAAAPAKVRVGAKGGFCNVTVNGASLGATPVEATVPSGTVRVSCKPATGATMSQSIQVGPGETGRVSFKIDP